MCRKRPFTTQADRRRPRLEGADGSQSLDLQRDALQVEGVAAKSTVVMGEVPSPTHE